jgi:hypothetical protein
MLSDVHKTPEALLRDPATSQYRQPSDMSAGGEFVPKLQVNAEKLRNVAQQVEAFLMRQIDRLQRELQMAEGSGDRYEIEQMSEEFELMREKWDSERQQERTRLQEDSDRLAEAWQRLEAEQREMLKYRVPNKMAGLSGSRTVVRSSGPLSPIPSPAPAEPSMVRGTSGTIATAAAHKNQLQFQQLRREMMEHARQRRKR